MTKEFKTENKCPICGQQYYLECYDQGIHDDHYYYASKCPDCGADFTEFYKLTYDHTMCEVENEIPNA